MGEWGCLTLLRVFLLRTCRTYCALGCALKAFLPNKKQTTRPWEPVELSLLLPVRLSVATMSRSVRGQTVQVPPGAQGFMPVSLPARDAATSDAADARGGDAATMTTRPLGRGRDGAAATANSPGTGPAAALPRGRGDPPTFAAASRERHPTFAAAPRRTTPNFRGRAAASEGGTQLSRLRRGERGRRPTFAAAPRRPRAAPNFRGRAEGPQLLRPSRGDDKSVT